MFPCGSQRVSVKSESPPQALLGKAVILGVKAKFRASDYSIGYITMCKVFIAFWHHYDIKYVRRCKPIFPGAEVNNWLWIYQ